MGAELNAHFASARLCLQHLKSVSPDALELLLLPTPLLSDCGEAARMEQTDIAQPAILATSAAIVNTLRTECGFDLADECAVALGHSMGEYTAHACASQAMAYVDALRLVVYSTYASAF